MTHATSWLVLACLASACLIVHLSMLVTDSGWQIIECLAVTDALHHGLNDTTRSIAVRGGVHDFMKQSIATLEQRLATQDGKRRAKRDELRTLQKQLDKLLLEREQAQGGALMVDAGTAGRGGRRSLAERAVAQETL